MKFIQYIKNLAIIGAIMALAISSVAPMQAAALIDPSPEGAEVLTVTCSPSTSSVLVGQDVAWNITVTGGISPAISLSGDEGLSGSTNTTHITYATVGTKSATVLVTSSSPDDQVSTMSCGSVTVTSPAPAETTPTVTPVSHGGSSSGRSNVTTTLVTTSANSTNSGEVLGASIGPVATTTTVACKPIIVSGFLKAGAKNDEQSVRALQHFLNVIFGNIVNENGVYDASTIAGVNKFQLLFKDFILKPWVDAGLLPANTPTGEVYKTTSRWINLMTCPSQNLPQPVLN